MEQAQEIFDKLNANKTGELSEDDLEAVAGGCDDDGGVFGPLLSWIGGLFGK